MKKPASASARAKRIAQACPEWLGQIAAQVGEGVAVADLKGQLIFANRAWARMHGYSVRELVGKHLRIGHTARQLRDEVAPFNRKVMKLGKWTGEVGHARKDGTEFMTEMTTTVFRGPKRKPIGIIGFARDITGRKNTENALRESEEKHRTMIETAHDIIWTLDLHGNVTYVNRRGEEITNYKIPGIIGKEYSFKVMKEDLPKVKDAVLQTLQGKPQSFEAGIYLPDDSILYLSVNQAPLYQNGTIIGAACFGRDITGRKTAEQALRASEEFSRSIIENSPIGFAVRNKQGQLLMYNKAWVRIWAMTPERIARHTREITGASFAQLFDHLGPYFDQVKNIFTSGGSLFIPELRIETPSPGSARWIRQYYYTIHDHRGEVERIVTLTDDITERKTAEEQLRESEGRYQTLAQISPVGIFRTDAAGSTTFVNPRWCEISGLPAPDAMGAGWLSAVHPDDREKIINGWRKSVSAQNVPPAEYRFARPDGSTSWVMGQAVPERNEQDRIVGYVGTITDITERKRTEQQLMESEVNYRQIFDGIVEGIYRTTPDGRILMANPALIRMLGYDTLEELLRVNLEREGYADPDSRRRLLEMLDRDGEVWGYQSQWRRKNGAVIIISENARAVKAIDGAVQYYEGSVEDITEHVQADLSLLDEKNKLAQLFEVSLSVARAGSIQEQLDLTMAGMANLSLFNRMVIVLKDDQGRNTHVAQIGITGPEVELIKSAPPVSEEARAKILNQKYRISNSFLIPHDDRDVQRQFSLKIATDRQSHGEWDSADNLLVPMMIKGKLIGYLTVDDPRDGRIPSLEVVRLLELYANQAAISIDNMRLYQDLEQSYYDTLKAFVAAMEAKDPYTKGHSKNVQRYALKIARHLGLPEDRIRLIDFSSLLHDIGKMGVKEDILSKPAALSDREYEEVKQHPEIGSLMVSAIENLSVTGPIIRAHHEYYDGSGYPSGIKGEQIPIESRIISVADAFEAMTSDRPYRKAFGHREALRRLQQASGTQFDRAIVSAFMELTVREGEFDVNA